MTVHMVEKLSPYVDGELSPGEKLAVDVHLRDCVVCARRLAELAAVDEMAQGFEVEAPAGYFETFPARLRERLPERTPAPRRLPMWALAAAAVLLVAVLTPLSFRERAGSPLVSEMPRLPEPKTPPAVAPEEAGDSSRRLGGSEAAPRKAEAGGEQHKQNETRALSPSVPAPAVGTEEEALKKQATPPPRTLEAPAAAPAAAPPQGSAASGRSGSPARPGGPWFQGQSQGQSPSAFAPPPSDQAAAEARKDERGMEDKALAERVPNSQAEEIPPAAEARAGKRREPVSAGLAEGGSAATGDGKEMADGLDALRARRPQSLGEARSQREAWRRFTALNPHHPQIDEARVAVIEAGALAFKLGQHADDRARAERDAKAYLARPDALQTERVRALLVSLAR